MYETELTTLINSGYSTHEIAEITGYSQTNVRYWLGKYGLKTIHGRRGGKKPTQEKNFCRYCGNEIPAINTYCNHACQYDYRAVQLGEQWQRGDNSVIPESTLSTGLLRGSLRRYLFIINNYRCQRCGWTHTDDRWALPPLECAHVDGNHANNSFDNYILLCPNCHAIDTREHPVEIGTGRWSNGADARNYNS